MRYIMREKWFSIGHDFYIQDENGRNVLFVDGKVFTIGEQLALKDMAGNELAYIKQRLLSFGPAYEIYRNGEHAATIKKHLFTLFRAKFTVDVPGPNDLEAQGDFLDHEYTFTRNGRIVAQVSKRWFSIRETYGINVADGEDDILIVASAVVIDMCGHKDDKND